MKRYLKTPEEVIDALQAGKVVTDGACRCKLYKGIIVCKEKEQWNITPTLSHEYSLYVEEPESLKLEVGKFYRTRDGRKAWIVAFLQWSHYSYSVAVLGNVSVHAVLENGCFCEDRTSPEDLVAPWEE